MSLRFRVASLSSRSEATLDIVEQKLCNLGPNSNHPNVTQSAYLTLLSHICCADIAYQLVVTTVAVSLLVSSCLLWWTGSVWGGDQLVLSTHHSENIAHQLLSAHKQRSDAENHTPLQRAINDISHWLRCHCRSVVAARDAVTAVALSLKHNKFGWHCCNLMLLIRRSDPHQRCAINTAASNVYLNVHPRPLDLDADTRVSADEIQEGEKSSKRLKQKKDVRLET